jgi:hypothetical protein
VLPALPAVSGTVFEAVGRNGGALCAGILEKVGELCAGGNEDEQLSADQEELLKEAQTTFGRALRALGPEQVLSVLPLNILEVRSLRVDMLPLSC